MVYTVTEQEVHESCVTCGLLCLPCEICAGLIGYGYGVTFCVCACGSIIALSPFHCWYVLMCIVYHSCDCRGITLYTVSIPIKAKADEQWLKVCFCIIRLVIWDLAVTQPGTISEEKHIYSVCWESYMWLRCKQSSITHSKIHVHVHS